MTQTLTVKNLTAHYGTTRVLDDLSLAVGAGELVSLLGASGCGKTTTLRLIAGFLEPTSGSITLGTKDLTKLPAYRRDIGLVFQNYALFPHLSVLDNVGFGLKQRGVATADPAMSCRQSATPWWCSIANTSSSYHDGSRNSIACWSRIW